RPTVPGTVGMVASDSVRGLNIAPAISTQGLTASGSTLLSGNLPNVSEVSVSTTSATAVSLTNSDGIFSFTSISANGGANGIIWNNANSNSADSFTVTGDGATANSGGTITESTG